MVEIREETTERNENDSATNANGPSISENTSNTSQQRTSFLEFVKTNRSEFLCFVLRIATIYFALGYVLPISSPASQITAYVKAFLAAAATNAFRLHQRMQSSTTAVFSRVFLSELMFQDSAHYLFYCLIFAFSSPVTMALVPITLYAFLHSASFGKKLAGLFGYGNNPLVVKIAQLTSQQNTANILSMIACAEIAIMPIFVAMIFVGKANIFFPFIYYRFISMRYLSRRNPYTRETFANLKMGLYQAAGHPNCPAFVRNLIYKTVALAERICPRVN